MSWTTVLIGCLAKLIGNKFKTPSGNSRSRNQPAGWQVANFVVSSRLRFARIFIFNRK